jgi:hypothetical protein
VTGPLVDDAVLPLDDEPELLLDPVVVVVADAVVDEVTRM